MNTNLKYYRINYIYCIFIIFQAGQILERHLVISDAPYTLERIKNLSNDTNNYNYNYRPEVRLPSVRDELSMYVEERQDHSKCKYLIRA